jgi:hypothetical protein
VIREPIIEPDCLARIRPRYREATQALIAALRGFTDLVTAEEPARQEVGV